MRTYFSLKFGPHWEDIALVRKFVISILSSTRSTDKTNAIKAGMVGTELMENAVKYSAVQNSLIKIEKKIDKSNMYFLTSNVCTREDVNEFKTILSMIEGEESIEKAYDKMVLKSLESENSSKLGIVRIMDECSAKVKYDINDDISELIDNVDKLENAEDYVMLEIEMVMPIV